MDSIKTYEPEIIQDAPFPGGIVTGLPSSQSSNGSNGEFSPATTKEASFPQRRISTEVMSASLNTAALKILQNFTLQQSGGLQIGNFQEGISGDIRITPNGITARDIAGINSFALDAITGDAVFRGQIASGALVTGEILLGDGSVVIDDLGLRSTTNFLKSSTTHASTQQFTTTSYVDLTDQIQTFTLERTTVILVMATLNLYLTESAGNTGDACIAIEIDGVVDNQGLANIRSGNNYLQTYTLIYPATLNAGTHTIKLRGKFIGIYAGAPVLNSVESYMSRIHLGS